jgi:hypothetical protein
MNELNALQNGLRTAIIKKQSYSGMEIVVQNLPGYH